MDRGTSWDSGNQATGAQFHQYPQPQQRQVVYQQAQTIQQQTHYQHEQHSQQAHPPQLPHQLHQQLPHQPHQQTQYHPVPQQVQYPQQQQQHHVKFQQQQQPVSAMRQQQQSWQPTSAEAQIFHYQNTQGEPKEVQWPPTSEESAQHHEKQMQGASAPVTMPLRHEIPLQQEPGKVIRTVPRATTPFRVVKWRGDDKWPPEQARQKSEPPRDVVRPVKQPKDYMPFFEAHKLPTGFPGYRAPPGTQFIGIDGAEPGYYYEQQQQHQLL
ncbi:unnamed protein product [Notodromas monacha]|uniref:Uncharacterized protein n=1 Tax=Notodromas monacha TaxID=399045 RepID=A0A7R9BGR6_9CRUS|nr:unnamed protein product [Notodromas monacha]CAG0913816.1 unnamed protein product [Notodromas monacha]